MKLIALTCLFFALAAATAPTPNGTSTSRHHPLTFPRGSHWRKLQLRWTRPSAINRLQPCLGWRIQPWRPTGSLPLDGISLVSSSTRHLRSLMSSQWTPRCSRRVTSKPPRRFRLLLLTMTDLLDSTSWRSIARSSRPSKTAWSRESAVPTYHLPHLLTSLRLVQWERRTMR